MTNKEKFKEVFGLEIDDTSDCGYFDCTDRECKDCSVKDTKDWWNTEYKEPTTKNDLGVDCVSRAEVLRLMKDNWHTHNGDWAMQESMDDIRALPAVTPQEPFKPMVEIDLYSVIKQKYIEREVLDKIRAEIRAYSIYVMPQYGRTIREADVLHIIDKYKAEIEPQESEDEEHIDGEEKKEK